jgi:hypothetical protein
MKFIKQFLLFLTFLITYAPNFFVKYIYFTITEIFDGAVVSLGSVNA